MTRTHTPATARASDAEVLRDVASRLAVIDGMVEPDFELLQVRFFSRIYAVRGRVGTTETNYILKISTTDRSSEEEFGHYLRLDALGIRTLVPVVCSGPLGYLVTRRETLTSFDRHLWPLGHRARCVEFRRLGRLFSRLDERTGESAAFDSDDFEHYVVPRIGRLSSLGEARKAEIVSQVCALARRLCGAPGRNCFVSDFALGNIHVDADDELVLLDHGDATTADVNSNIAYLYLAMRFGPLNRYIGRRHTAEDYFRAFLLGYDDREPDRERLPLYLVQHTINMISFLESRTPALSVRPRRLASALSNRYLMARYHRHLTDVVKLIREF